VGYPLSEVLRRGNAQYHRIAAVSADSQFLVGNLLVAHVVEGYVVVPLIQHKFVYIPPAMILAMQFLMDMFAGVIGVAFATPLMVVAMVLIKKLYFKQEWDEPADEPAAA
jgi:predicted PurR-regulated permease PerM